ncbi:beta-glucosidase [Jatrophihabitans endophyticus]|uniref:Exo-alpha-(1->6)-L-arabinopyranosidase n=1 Tax=Jatrophihabitans endophyticus TaxID=1206085 RepID=A0A1M5MU27_9ACTN|nr:glycoside hydrolase family 3 N-terminal domain-containing protein [Jatrophihabitans endophyticus]SHG80657.1 beta-glucosidase [Jatrophihabitans endophyticus]
MSDTLDPRPATGPSRRRLLGAAAGATALGAASATGLLGATRADADPAADRGHGGSRGSADPALPADRRRPGHGRPDRATERRIDALLRRMTLAEKLGQLQLVNTADLAKAGLGTAGGVGGLFSVTDSAVLDAVQHQAVEKTRLGIPLIFGLDVIHGYVTNFPIPLGTASSWDPEVARTDGRISAAEARASGQHWTYAPMMDVTHEPRWGRIAEGNGEDPFLTAAFAAAKVDGYQGSDYSARDRLAACMKHYVAYGGAEGGRDYNTVDVSLQRLHNLYLPPFLAAVRAGVATAMASFNTIAGVPAHGSEYAIREVLKERYDFDGFVVSDYTGIQELINHGLAGGGADAAAAGLNAGVDMEMVSTNYVDFGVALLAAGRVTRREIDDAVRRLLRIKFRLGLFENPYTDPKRAVTTISAANAKAARAAAARSMVLLRNEDDVLPFGSGVKTVALVGPLGRATTDLNGTWAGLGPVTPPVTIEAGLQAAGKAVVYVKGCDVNGTDTSGFAAAVAAARKADAVVLAVGETADMSGEAAARSDIGLPGVQSRLVEAVAAAAKRTAVVLINGRPLTIADVLAAAPAVLEAWAPGSQGGNAIADVLTGAVNPGGKLPVSFPRSVGQVPIYYNHENTGRPADPDNKYTSKYLDLPSGPQLEFGFGLSYTTFAVADLRLSSHTLHRSGGSVSVTVTVRNTGEVAGDEVVQLYIHDPVASVVQPVRRLRGFQRVTLAAGASRTVRFTLTPSDVGFYDGDARFVVERGTIHVYAGTSSDDTPLTDELRVV